MAYCTAGQVTSRLYAGKSSGAPTDAARDALITEKIEALSRRFDHETGRKEDAASSVTGGGPFEVTYATRYFSGMGSQWLDVDAFASIFAIAYNTAPLGTPSWSDVTAEIAAGKIAYRPVRFWPKRQLFRLNTWITDPYMNGNTRISGVWGVIQPDLTLAPPIGSSWNGLTDPQIQSLAPNPAGPPYGWWKTPKDVSDAIASWVVYNWGGTRAGFGDQAGSKKTDTQVAKDIPPDVAAVIKNYRGGTSKLALIGLDGSDVTSMTPGGMFGDMSTRWAGWQTFDPNTGQGN